MTPRLLARRTERANMAAKTTDPTINDQSGEVFSRDDEIDDTLDTEHDVFQEFNMNEGDDPNTDVLDLIKVEGTPSLRSRIRILLEKNRDVFSTTLAQKPVNTTVLKSMGQFYNQGTPRVSKPRETG